MARLKMDVRSTKKGIRAKAVLTPKAKAKAKRGTSKKRGGFNSF